MKNKINTYGFLMILSLFLVMSLGSFDQEDRSSVSSENQNYENELSPLVQKALDERIKRYQKTILDRCKQEAYEDAEAYIDSLVAEELKLQANDTMYFPQKPKRPALNAPIILNDSTEIAPILKDTSARPLDTLELN